MRPHVNRTADEVRVPYLLDTTTSSFPIEVLDAILWPDAQDAVESWNQHLGREVFVLLP
jgi:hypothetical protein